MNRYLITGIITAIVWEALSSQAWTQLPPCSSPGLPIVTQSMNNVRQSNAIVIGKVSERPYIVVVPGNSNQLLNLVRSYVADAFLAQHRLGAYVYVGGYANRFQAECWSYLLKSHGLDARVVYFR
ncbi:hypothetical protein [Anabaena sp. UHCC 0451]|uniref:hypothetical protein n=1 Tax=Anabaena sp. UHCC 0451 TaxID=2055235 RepID=UPI002B2183C4|nr:hypothetical protein [Anabaena sp. UHCC 0451]MEA5578568.1 hypothetical protein [Anabaena sp. UHCC 0451]